MSDKKNRKDDEFDTDGVEIESVNDSNPESERPQPDDGDVISLSSAKVAELERAREDAEKWKKDYLYLRADFDNYRKSVVKERSDLVKYGTERFLVDLLEVFDNFERALELDVNSNTLIQFKDGIQLTAAELRKILQKHGVREILSAGEAFNPAFHEALSSEETTAVPAGHVSRVYKKAYKLHDRVIRPAQVVVAKEPTKPAPASDQTSDDKS